MVSCPETHDWLGYVIITIVILNELHCGHYQNLPQVVRTTRSWNDDYKNDDIMINNNNDNNSNDDGNNNITKSVVRLGTRHHDAIAMIFLQVEVIEIV